MDEEFGPGNGGQAHNVNPPAQGEVEVIAIVEDPDEVDNSDDEDAAMLILPQVFVNQAHPNPFAGPQYQPFVNLGAQAGLPTPAENGAHHDSERKHKKVPIYIVEDHQDVVPFIHENIRGKYLPVRGNTLIHLDSHPDMLIPKDMNADDSFQPRVLYDNLEIENWILPNCYTGIFHHIVWVKPPWAHQIRTRNQKIYIGKCLQTGCLRLECRENYYIAECLFELRHHMENVKEINFDCITLGNRLVDSGDDIGEMKSIAENNDKVPTVLDIDLDFFSTKNPFLTLHEDADLYARLRPLFRFQVPESMSDPHIFFAQNKRQFQLSEMSEIFSHLESSKRMPDREEGTESPAYREIKSIVEALSEHYPMDDIHFGRIFDAGCTIDDGELPHHVSTQEELNIMFQCFENFIDTFLEPPRIITIARSSLDDYTPRHQVNLIQAKVLEILNKKFPCAEPILSYSEPDQGVEEEEAMQVSSGTSTLSEFTESPINDSGDAPDPRAARQASSSPEEMLPYDPSDEPGPSNR